MFYDQEANKIWVKYGCLTIKWQTDLGNKGETALGERGGRLISRGTMDKKWINRRHKDTLER